MIRLFEPDELPAWRDTAVRRPARGRPRPKPAAARCGPAAAPREPPNRPRRPTDAAETAEPREPAARPGASARAVLDGLDPSSGPRPRRARAAAGRGRAGHRQDPDADPPARAPGGRAGCRPSSAWRSRSPAGPPRSCPSGWPRCCPSSRAVTVATFHGLGLRILREQHDRSAWPTVRVADEAERLAVLAELTGAEADARRAGCRLLAGSAGTRPARTSRDLRRATDGAARAGPGRPRRPGRPAGRAARRRSRARGRYRARWPDLRGRVPGRGRGPVRAAAAAGPPDGDLCVIGDPDQAIYAFRGARRRVLPAVPEDFPGARTVRLTRNYRSQRADRRRRPCRRSRPATLVPGRVLTPARHRPGPAGAAAPGRHRAGRGGVRGGRSTSCSAAPRSTRSTAGGGRAAAPRPRYRSPTSPCCTAPTPRPARWSTRCRAGVPYQKRSHNRLAARPGCGRCCVAALRRRRHRAGAAAGRRASACQPAAGAGARRGAGPDCRGPSAAAVELLTPLAGGAAPTWTGSWPSWPRRRGRRLDPRADRSRCSPCTPPRAWSSRWCSSSAARTVCCRCGSAPAPTTQLAEERRLLFVGMTRAQDQLELATRQPIRGAGPRGRRRRRRSWRRSATPCWSGRVRCRGSRSGYSRLACSDRRRRQWWPTEFLA